MIANCGAMGVDWERLSLSGYIEALVAHNAANDPKSARSNVEVGDDLSSFWRAHTVQ